MQVADLDVRLANLQPIGEGGVRIAVARNASNDGLDAAKETQIEYVPRAIRLLNVAFLGDDGTLAVPAPEVF